MSSSGGGTRGPWAVTALAIVSTWALGAQALAADATELAAQALLTIPAIAGAGVALDRRRTKATTP